MQSTSVPSKFPIPFANSGTKNAIPTNSQIGVTPGAASLTDGFPPLTFTALSAGGVPPSGADFNGILNMLSAGLQWANAGGVYTYDSTFSTSIGGYPKGAMLARADGTGFWVSNVDNNTTNPESGVSANWTPIIVDNVKTFTATATLTIANAGLVLVDATGGNVMITLPAANSLAALSYKFVRIDTTPNTVTIQRAGTDTISGVTSMQLGTDPLQLVSDGSSEWRLPVPKVRGRIQPITASVASSALTLGLNPTVLDFRSATLTDGTVNTRNIAAPISLVVPSGATLGTVNATQARLVLLAIDNAGTVELAVVNLAGGNNLDETTLISTTAISAAATANNVIYSTTARTNVPFRVVGFIDITEATAGTWATAPTTIQGEGGQALAALQSIGYGQTWQAVTRTSGTTYYNTTGRSITIKVDAIGNFTSAYVNISINGVALGEIARADLPSGTPAITGQMIIPAGASYVLTDNNIGSRSTWELR